MGNISSASLLLSVIFICFVGEIERALNRVS